MSCEPLQNIDEPSAVSRRIPSIEEGLGPGKTETEAPESTRNSRPERISCTNWRVGLENSSWEAATEGPAGWTEVSTCRTTCFPKRNRVSCNWLLYHHVSCETNTGQAGRWAASWIHWLPQAQLMEMEERAPRNPPCLVINLQLDRKFSCSSLFSINSSYQMSGWQDN